MIDIKELAEANRHCREKNCERCPFKNQDNCTDREKLNEEVFVDFLDMIGIYSQLNSTNKWRNTMDDKAYIMIAKLQSQLDDLQKYADNDEFITLTQDDAKEIIELLKG